MSEFYLEFFEKNNLIPTVKSYNSRFVSFERTELSGSVHPIIETSGHSFRFIQNHHLDQNVTCILP